MSFYFRDKPSFSERLRGKLGDDLLEEIKQHFDDDHQSFFSSNGGRSSRPDSFDKRAPFSRGFPFDDDDDDGGDYEDGHDGKAHHGNDDEGGRAFGRRSDIRAHLDDLAARHPEFAEHLLGPPWADVSRHGTTQRRSQQRRRGSGSSNHHQAQSDEDARSQASGSSAASAASSHGEAEGGGGGGGGGGGSCNKRQEESRRNHPIPQYGLRNTVDIGQQRHDMENNDRNARSQRSMSAPPENRQQPPAHQSNEEQEQQPQGQRFVSRVDITPQHNQKQQQPAQQQASNVRHIPIFVEGRDEPVVPKNVEDTHFQRQASPPHFTRQPSPPHFTRQSPFAQSWGSRQQWPPHFQDTFYQPQSTFEQPSTRRFHEQQRGGFGPHQQTFPPRNQPQKQRPEQQRRQGEQHQQKQPEQHQHSEQQQQQQQQQQETPKAKAQTVPKDALERVALVQNEVDSLAQQVKEYTGNSRKDKRYIYLDEMLTRELIKLDDIETEGRENVRQARKNAIRAIQKTISLLESKAPLPAQQPNVAEVEEPHEPANEEQQAEEAAMEEEKQQQQQQQQQQGQSEEQREKREEAMDMCRAEKDDKTANEAIPLPSAASSDPAHTSTTENREENERKEVAKTEATEESKAQGQQETMSPMSTESQERAESSDATAADAQGKAREQSQEKRTENTVQQQKNTGNEAQNESAAIQEQTKQEGQAENIMEVEKQPTPSPKLPKKTKKTKKQQTPVSQEAIPLPAPEIAESK